MTSIAKPKVTVICTVYNHESFLEEALNSVISQSHPNLELFIIDNGSKDKSRIKIEEWAKVNRRLQPRLILREMPINYCASFNEVLFQSSGEYIIDLSGDDKLLSGHIEASLSAFQKYPIAVVSFSDAELEKGGKVKRFYEADKIGPPTHSVGDVYLNVISHYCISTVTLVFKATQLKAIGGYDEALVYEDFDILCRLARKFSFCYSPHVGVKKRVLPSSFSASQYKTRNSSMLESTLLICGKIKRMNRSEEENQALFKRVMYEAFHALGSANFDVAKGFLELASDLSPRSIKLNALKLWQKSALNISAVYQKLK